MIKSIFLALALTFVHSQLLCQDVTLYHSSGKSAVEVLNSNFGDGASESFVDFMGTMKYLVKHGESDAIAGLIKFPLIYQDSKGRIYKINSRLEFDKHFKNIFNDKIVSLFASTTEKDWKVDQLGVGVGIDKVYFQCRSNDSGLYWRLVTVNQW